MDDPRHSPPDDGTDNGRPADVTSQLDAFYFDGRTSRKRAITLRLTKDLEIVEDGVPIATWPFEDMRRVDGPQSQLRLRSLSDLPLARLEIADPALQQTVIAQCPSLNKGQERQVGRIVGWSLAAAASIVLLVVYGIPLAAGRIAPLVPRGVEARIGEAVDRQLASMFGDKLCTRTDGWSALQRLVGKLTQAGGITEPFKAEVIASPVPNAFAMPGGKIYVLDGLLQKANNVDEIAGVLAHELGHVQHRDVLRVLIQNGGTSYLVGLFFGDVLGGGAAVFATRSLFQSSYSRDVEREADAFAETTMRALGRSPKPMAELLFRVTGAQANKGLDIISTHPLTEERLATLGRADRGNSGAPLLSDDEWRALKSICIDR
jgi:Zn-dependent protease with chaperone function